MPKDDFNPVGVQRPEFRRMSESEKRLQLRSKKNCTAFCYPCHSWDWRNGNVKPDDEYFKTVIFEKADPTYDKRTMQVIGEDHHYKCTRNSIHTLIFHWGVQELERMKKMGNYPGQEAAEDGE